MELKDIRAVVDLMRRNDLTVFEMEREGFRIKIEREGSGRARMERGAPGGNALEAFPPQGERPAGGPAPAAVAEAREGATDDAAREIVSPMVGTVYHGPAPDAPPFVAVGDRVTPETVVCIIEAMKVMNEIRAEIDGVIGEVLVENGKPVQFGQGLFRLR